MKRLSWMIALGAVAVGTGCLGLAPYDGPGQQASSPYTDEDAGTGYEVDLAGEDLASGPVPAGRYHPLGYAAVNVHGRDLKLQVQDCRTCHGQDLTGGVVGAGGASDAPPSCDSCHQAGWRTNCTYCHGTAAGNAYGNPPRDLNEETDPTKISFPGHVAHVSGRITQPLDCIQCHRKPTDALSPYHIFDASPRRAENNLTGGLSAVGVYDPVLLQCTNLYCHGNGRGSNGTVSKTMKGPLVCSSCHADVTTSAKWNTMSGDHSRHLGGQVGVTCIACHAGTTAADPSTVSDKTLHINGKPDVKFGAGTGTIAFDPNTKRCTGSCHNKNHSNTW